MCPEPGAVSAPAGPFCPLRVRLALPGCLARGLGTKRSGRARRPRRPGQPWPRTMGGSEGPRPASICVPGRGRGRGRGPNMCTQASGLWPRPQ